MFDFFRNLFENIFGGDDEEDLVDWGGDSDSISFAPDISEIDYGALDEANQLGDRLIEDPAGGEFVQEFYDLGQVLEYVEPAPENILMIVVDPDQEVYYVYRFDS